MTFERVLCPVDLSDASRRAFDYARAFAGRHEGALTVVHVVEAAAWVGMPVEGLAGLAADTRAALTEQLDWWVARRADPSAVVQTQVREGPVVTTILDAARELRADLIVVGTHGRSGFQRFALGSVAERVLRRSPCPVIIVPAREDARVRPGGNGRILCATDGSDASLQAVECARRLASDLSAPLSLVTVFDWPFGERHDSKAVARLRQDLEREAGDMLVRLTRDWTVPVDTAVRCGKAGTEIVRYADERLAELIVVGVSGRGAIDRALLGSTAGQVARDASCPTLTVPAAAGSR